jgi:hypothetical protein
MNQSTLMKYKGRICRQECSPIGQLLCRLVLTSAILLPCTNAATFVAYGPDKFTRAAGNPSVITRTFAVANPTTTYTMRIEKLAPSASASITLNGVLVARPADFASSPAMITKSVTLQSSNKLEVLMGGVRGDTITVQILGVDDVLPKITASASPPANANGWNNSTVTVSFTCTDTISGVASCSAPVSVVIEGANQIITGTATDKAGNTATASVTIRLDRTPPTNTASTAPAPNAAGWNNTDVTVTFTCSDAFSTIGFCPTAVIVTAESASQVVSGIARDKADNTTTASTTLKLDRTPPALAVTSPPNGTSVVSGPVAVAGAVSDALSGVAAVTCNGLAASVSGLSAVL